jgi:hypothetical protein
VHNLNLDLYLISALLNKCRLLALELKLIIKLVVPWSFCFRVGVTFLLLLPYHCMSSDFHIIGIILMHTSHSCIVVTETPEDAPVEPTETIETEPGAEFVVEQEENQGKQLSMIP